MTQPVTPDLTNAGMDVTELAVGAKDVIASTAERFTSVIEGLLQHLSLENVLMQIAAVFVSMAIGYVISRRINTLVENMIYHTQESGVLGMEPEVAGAMDRLRTFMFQHVYTNPVAKGEESKAKDMLCRLFEYYMKNPERLPPDFLPQLDFDGMERIVCDYIAGMTDRYAVYKYSELFIPATWQVR